MRDQLSLAEYGRDYGQLTAEEKDLIDIRTRRGIKANTYDPDSGTLQMDAARTTALEDAIE